MQEHDSIRNLMEKTSDVKTRDNLTADPYFLITYFNNLNIP